MTPTVQAEGIVVSTTAIREHFPALARVHNDSAVAYFDGPGGTQVPRAVAEAMTDYLYHHNANTHWAYPTSAETDTAIEQARQACADFLNAAPDEIAFGANMTTLTFHLARALGKDYGPRSEIVITELDHHANIAPWQRLAQERGVTVRTIKLISETGQVDWDQFADTVNERTRLIAIGAASNALGTVNDLPRAIGMARAVGAQVFVDAVHYVPHLLADVRALDCDFLAMSSYKFYGPHIGVMFGKRELLDAIDFPKLMPAPDLGSERVETGTQNHEGMMGTAAAIDFLASLAKSAASAEPVPAGRATARRLKLETAYKQLHERTAALVRQLWSGLSAIKGVRLYGPAPDQPRTPTISFTVAAVPSTEVARRLAQRGLFLSHGDFYAATVIERLGLDKEGLVRAGCACYTTVEEIERLIEGVAEIAGPTAGSHR